MVVWRRRALRKQTAVKQCPGGQPITQVDTMLNSSHTQRVLRPEGSPVTTPPLRRTGQAHGHTCFPSPRHALGARISVACNAQSYGRGQPPNQPQPMALARRPFYDPMEPSQPAFIKLSDVMDKDVISSTTGRKLGKLGEAWVDASRLEVTCFDLESSGAIGVVPLLTIKQVGDVVLVQEDGVLRQPLDTRFGFTKLLGWEVRTPNNRALGKVRDMSFSRDTGTISKIEFDDFGLRFLRADFFDRFSVPADAIRQCAYGIVSLAADNVQYQEKQGLLSTLLRRVGGAQQLAGLLADGSRGSEAAGLLPSGYSYEQWQNDVRMWEAQTGCSYEEYMMQTGQQSPFGGGGMRRNALPPGRPQPQALLPEAGGGVRQPGAPNYALPPSSSAPQQQAGRPGGFNPTQQQQQQMPQSFGAPGQQGQYAGGGYGSAGYSAAGGGGDPRFRGAAAQPPPRGASAQGRYPGTVGPQQPPQPQWPPQPGAQQPTGGPQQQWGQQPQWGQQQQLPQTQPMQQPQMGQRPGAGAPGGGRGSMPGPGGRGPAAPAGPAAPQQPQPPPQQQPQQYGWPGAAPGPSAGPGQGPAPSVPAPAGGGPRTEEWMARGPQGPAAAGGYEQQQMVMEAPGRPPTSAGAAPAGGQAPPAAEAPGWDMPSSTGARQPY